MFITAYNTEDLLIVSVMFTLALCSEFPLRKTFTKYPVKQLLLTLMVFWFPKCFCITRESKDLTISSLLVYLVIIEEWMVLKIILQFLKTCWFSFLHRFFHFLAIHCLVFLIQRDKTFKGLELLHAFYSLFVFFY